MQVLILKDGRIKLNKKKESLDLLMYQIVKHNP